MDQVKQLNSYLNQITSDGQLKAIHICLYMALFYSWMVNGFKNPFNISRSKIMRMAKIKSKATYHKCIGVLKKSGHIRYQPSYHPTNGTLITLLRKELSPDVRPELDDRKISGIQD